MKYDLTKLFYDYIQEEENKAFRESFWERPANAEAEKAMQPIWRSANMEQEDAISTYAACAEEFGFLTGFQLAMQLMATGLKAPAPVVEVAQ